MYLQHYRISRLESSCCHHFQPRPVSSHYEASTIQLLTSSYIITLRLLFPKYQSWTQLQPSLLLRCLTTSYVKCSPNSCISQQTILIILSSQRRSPIRKSSPVPVNLLRIYTRNLRHFVRNRARDPFEYLRLGTTVYLLPEFLGVFGCFAVGEAVEY